MKNLGDNEVPLLYCHLEKSSSIGSVLTPIVSEPSVNQFPLETHDLGGVGDTPADFERCTYVEVERRTDTTA